MASLAEIRAKLKEQESRTGGSQSGGGDNAIYPFWNIKEGESATMRFLPDGDGENTFFWKERLMIKLPFRVLRVRLTHVQYRYKYHVWKCTEKHVQY